MNAKPIEVVSQLKIIIDQRSGICKDCKWHPDVCQHCLLSLHPHNNPETEDPSGLVELMELSRTVRYDEPNLGGRGKCELCGDIVNNVAYHMVHDCPEKSIPKSNWLIGG